MPERARSARPSLSLHVLFAPACALLLVGCASWLGVEPKHQNPIVNHYNQLAEKIVASPPDIQSPVPAPTMGIGRILVAPNVDERWPMSLAEAIRLGIENNKIIRQNAQFMSPSNPVMQSPDSVASVFDPDIQNTGVLYGARGIPAAMSDFDPRVTVTSMWGNSQTPSNSTILPPPNNILEQNTTQFQSRIEQQLTSGGVFAINQNWNYLLSNQPFQLFNSSYTGLLGAEYRQPLWAGSGAEFTSIAGPLNQRARGFSLVSQGVVIAHINKRISDIDLRENLQNLVREIGDLYWELYQGYQDYEFEHATAEVARELYEQISSRSYKESGVDVAQAEDAFYDARGREEQALSNLYQTEAKLRRLLVLTIDDSRMIFPSDAPREDDVRVSRSMCLYEALCNRTELSRQKTNLHSLELQLGAAKKLVAPRLDFVSGYALNGFGHNFLNADTTNFNSAVANLYSGNQTTWSAGFEYSIPLWLRQEKAQVAQLEFRILKAKTALAAQEDEIAHELNSVLLTIAKATSTSKFNRQRVQATRKRVQLAKAVFDSGYNNSDQLLRSLSSQAQAQSVYNRSITELNKALRDLLYRTGRILPADGVTVLGMDGLPLIEPADPQQPFRELQTPLGLPSDELEPNELPPSPSAPTIPEKPPETKPLEKIEPKQKKSPMADGGRDTPISRTVQPSRVTEAKFELPPSPTKSITPQAAVATPPRRLPAAAPIVHAPQQAIPLPPPAAPSTLLPPAIPTAAKEESKPVSTPASAGSVDEIDFQQPIISSEYDESSTDFRGE